MLSSLLVKEHRLEKVLNLTVEGIHSEKYDSHNQPWDDKVAETVSNACNQITIPAQDPRAWYAIHVRWFVNPSTYNRDLDNLRLKPIIDELTDNGLWPDDDVTHVRAIYNEAVLVDNNGHEHVEVTVYRVLPPE